MNLESEREIENLSL